MQLARTVLIALGTRVIGMMAGLSADFAAALLSAAAASVSVAMLTNTVAVVVVVVGDIARVGSYASIGRSPSAACRGGRITR